MKDRTRDWIIQRLKKEEGWRPEVYKDHLGKPTIGYGTLLPLYHEERQDLADWRDIGLPQLPPDEELQLSMTEGQLLLESRFDPIVEELRPLFHAYGMELDEQAEGVQKAVCDVAYNIGVPKLRKFRKMLGALREGDRHMASVELMDSRYAEQVPNRAGRNAELLVEGMYRAD